MKIRKIPLVPGYFQPVTVDEIIAESRPDEAQQRILKSLASGTPAPIFTRGLFERNFLISYPADDKPSGSISWNMAQMVIDLRS